MTNKTTKYFAVCNVNGPISVELDGESEVEAMASFGLLDGRKAIDVARTDIEDALDIEGAAEMGESDFADALEAAGAEHVRSLAEVVNAHAGTVAHEVGGWSMWAVRADG
jgi:class 3 adenylate cyclase